MRKPPYSSAATLERLRAMLLAGGCTLRNLCERLEVSDSTARRLLGALEAAGDPLVEETGDDRRKVWRLLATAREHTLRISTSQLIALVVARNAAHYLAGTGFDADLNDVLAMLLATLREKDAALARTLHLKFFDLAEQPVDHRAQGDVIDELTSALWHDEQVEVRRRSTDGTEKTHLFDPYTMTTYKKGLYFFGFSHDKKQRISLGLDGVLEARRVKGARFVYPEDHDPRDVFQGCFGMVSGPMTRVRIRFDRATERYVKRRILHESASFEDGPAGTFDLLLYVAGTRDVESFVLGYGDLAEVIEPATLRKSLGERLTRAAGRYSGGNAGLPA